MLLKISRNLLFFISVLSFFFSTAAFQLKEKDVRLSTEEMLSYHAEYHEFDVLLAKRSLKIMIEQFDPEKLYLLVSETQSYLSPHEEKLKKIVKQYHQDDLSEWKKCEQLIQKAITRARLIRKELTQELIEQQNLMIPKEISENYVNYAATEKDLKERIRQRLLRILASENKPNLTQDEKRKIFAFWEKRYLRVENPRLKIGLPVTAEHHLAMTVLKAIAKSLDAHTAYFSPEEALEMRTLLEKQFEGIGVVLKEGVDGVIIQDMIKGGPAERSGKILPGDLLVEINGQSVEQESYEEILKKLQGKDFIQLGVKREKKGGEPIVERVRLLREKIVMQDERVQYSIEPFAKGIIGKITLPSFYENEEGLSCEADLKEALRNLKKKGELLGLVIDMRENSGGFLKQAVKVAGLFIANGVVVISKYAKDEVQYLRNLDGRSYYQGPFVILTSKASASAAEIVAQALQDYGTAIVVGDERTYGKGTIQYQTVTDPAATSFFKVTVGRYYTVSGRTTQIEGVIADIQVPTMYSPFKIGERYLEYPLKNDRVPSAYIDPLTDVDQRNHPWFKQNYLPNLQKKLSVWTQMLPQLKQNCSYRLEHNKDYTLFLNAINPEKNKGVFSLTPQTNFGVEDLQMTEAVNIIKDMISLKAESSKK